MRMSRPGFVHWLSRRAELEFAMRRALMKGGGPLSSNCTAGRLIT